MSNMEKVRKKTELVKKRSIILSVDDKGLKGNVKIINKDHNHQCLFL